MKDNKTEPAQEREATKAVAVSTTEKLDEVRVYNEAPYLRKTPISKVKKNAKDFDYVKGSYMDKSFKDHSPLYEYTLVQVEDILEIGQVRATVILKSIVTGNAEVGVGAARIQVTRDAREALVAGKRGLMPFDIVDYDKNLKSAVENARKNAQRQFGIAADVYRRQEFEPTPGEMERFEILMSEVSLKYKMQFKEDWESLGADFTEWLDAIEDNLESYKKIETDKPKSTGSIL